MNNNTYSYEDAKFLAKFYGYEFSLGIPVKHPEMSRLDLEKLDLYKLHIDKECDGNVVLRDEFIEREVNLDTFELANRAILRMLEFGNEKIVEREADSLFKFVSMLYRDVDIKNVRSFVIQKYQQNKNFLHDDFDVFIASCKDMECIYKDLDFGPIPWLKNYNEESSK